MYKVADFIRWAVDKANKWQYLFGSVRVQTNQATLDRYYENHYKNSMTRAMYDAYTRDWDRDGYATDCQGLCDAYLTYECGEQTDINADMNYRLWCGRKGKITEITEPFLIGEAVFRMGTGGKMNHVGWICGYMPDGVPLVIEARGIAYGVVVTRLDRRDFTHRGLMTAKFDYNAADEPQEEKPMDPIVLSKTSPMMQGEGIRLMQQALNALGYTDDAGRALDEDGKCGACTMQAVTAFANAHTTIESAEGVEFAPEFVLPLGVYTAFYFRTENLPEELK